MRSVFSQKEEGDQLSNVVLAVALKDALAYGP